MCVGVVTGMLCCVTACLLPSPAQEDFKRQLDQFVSEVESDGVLSEVSAILR